MYNDNKYFLLKIILRFTYLLYQAYIGVNIMSNFGFLKDKKEYALFAAAAIEAEKVFATAPAMCAVGSRKALELGVKWVYSADFSIRMPYKDNLQSLIYEPSFRFALDSNT
jgi:type I site-specific restriction-modification system, R (restriction) subunit and related helicases